MIYSKDSVINTKVISISNNNEIFIGRLHRFELIKGNSFPIVLATNNVCNSEDKVGAELVCFGLTVPYSEELLAHIKELVEKQINVWEYFCSILTFDRTLKSIYFQI